MNVMAILTAILTILSSPGGLAALDKMFTDKSIDLKTLDNVLASLKDAPDPKQQ